MKSLTTTLIYVATAAATTLAAQTPAERGLEIAREADTAMPLDQQFRFYEDGPS